MVVGGAGFIGSHLVERLLDLGHHVEVIDDLSRGRLAHLAEARKVPDRRLRVHHMDVADTGAGDLIARVDPSVIFHVSGHASESFAETEPAKAIESTLATLVLVLEAARRCRQAKVVVASSIAAGPTPKRGEVPPSSDEIALLGLVHELAHRCLARYRERFAVDFTDLRLANVYGPRQSADDGALVAKTLEATMRNAPVRIDGDGEQSRDFLFVDDAVDALCRSVERGGGLALEVGTGQQTSVRRVIAGVLRQVSEASGTEIGEVQIEQAPARPTEVGRRVCDPRRAELYLGWSSFTELDDGLRRTVDWWRASAGTDVAGSDA